MANVDLSVVIVNFNARERIENCLNSLLRSETTYSLEVWVVDNASADDSVQMIRKTFPQVRLIDNAKNVGYSKANNQAIRQTNSRYVLLLNPDVEVQKDTVHRIVQYADKNANVGICGCCVR